MEEKVIVTRQVLAKNMEEIEQFLTKKGSKFRFFEVHKAVADENVGVVKQGDVLHHIWGYRSKLVTVYLDKHNNEITLMANDPRTKQAKNSIMEANKAMVKNPEFFYKLLAEKQLEYEKKFFGQHNK